MRTRGGSPSWAIARELSSRPGMRFLLLLMGVITMVTFVATLTSRFATVRAPPPYRLQQNSCGASHATGFLQTNYFWDFSGRTQNYFGRFQANQDEVVTYLNQTTDGYIAMQEVRFGACNSQPPVPTLCYTLPYRRQRIKRLDLSAHSSTARCASTTT